jgi:sugar phosphate isomerase/epimerase
MKRRTFIQNASLAIAGGLFLPSLLKASAPAAGRPIGIQLYTLKDVIMKDVKGTLQKLAEIGYKELEAYGYNDGKAFSMSYADFNSMVKDMGMSVVSGHYLTGNAMPGMKGTITNEWDRAVEDAARAGQPYMCIAWLHPNERKTIDDYKKICAQINKANESCRKAGVILGYHNHDFEFMPVDGKVPYDVMLSELDSSVILELDIYWSTFANVDALELFKKNSGRVHLWHVKDMNKEKRQQQTDVGAGSIDYKKIFAGAEQSGMKHFFLEQEFFEKPQFESVTNGFNYLKSFV